MASRSTPNRWVLISALGIASVHCGGEDTFNLDCAPSMPQVGEEVALSLDYDVESETPPFSWSDTIGLGTFGDASSALNDTSGDVSNTFTPTTSGSTTIQVRRGETVVASCDLQVQSIGAVEVSVQVVGNGVVTFGEFECRVPCQRQVDRDAVVEFMATADEGWRFDAWGGDCADFTTTTATVTIDGPTSCEARFVETPAAGPNEVVVAAGTFTRGCNLEQGCRESELPLRDITMSEFVIDRFEVTVGEYRACVTAGECEAPAAGNRCNFQESGREQHPINCVTWDQARTFCEAQQKRLPTEAEWEMAARGVDDERLYPWGDDPATCVRANHASIPDNQSCGSQSTTRVGEFPDGASPNTLLDMAGNVFEWVNDRFDPNYYETSPDTDPQGPDQGDRRVVRGGSFVSTSEFITVFGRGGEDPSTATSEYGFRCAR